MVKWSRLANCIAIIPTESDLVVYFINIFLSKIESWTGKGLKITTISIEHLSTYFMKTNFHFFDLGLFDTRIL